MQAWARKEAIARKKAVENGEELVYGKWFYNPGQVGLDLDKLHAVWGPTGCTADNNDEEEATEDE